MMLLLFITCDFVEPRMVRMMVMIIDGGHALRAFGRVVHSFS